MGFFSCCTKSSTTQTSPRDAVDNNSQQTSSRRVPDVQLSKCSNGICVRDNVTYIVAAIALRNGPAEGQTEVLLIREAKQGCRGKYYMPAGHVEPGETIENAVKRELLEETGLIGELETLISVEAEGNWYRMAFSVRITGGALKTVEDKESLDASWQPLALLRRVPCPLPLRRNDFFKLVDQAEQYANWKAAVPLPPWAPVLCQDEPQSGMFVEFVVVHQQSPGNGPIECLVHRCIREQQQLLDEHSLRNAFPTVAFGLKNGKDLASAVSSIYKHVLTDGKTVLEQPEAVTALHCSPKQANSGCHGIRLRLLCRHKRSERTAKIKDSKRYHWLAIDSEDVLASLYLLDGQFRPQLDQQSPRWAKNNNSQ